MEFYVILISGFSLVVSTIALIFSIISNAKSNRLKHENVRLANAMVETDIRATIGNETARVNEVAMKLNTLIAKQKTEEIKDHERHELKSLKKNLTAAIQGMLNAYEEACSKYLDGKIDKERFRRTYHVEIRNLLEAQDLKLFFAPHTSSYRAIIKVYNEWENLEK
ncbi:MAG: hypothetical protein ACE5KZ_00195 [Candidatus Scalinduaceae bacterium]